MAYKWGALDYFEQSPEEADVKVYTTFDYSIFKTLDGNRAVANSRVKKIEDSIDKNGYIPNPIIVNENMEVIDGQGRLQACKNKLLPVMYIVANGTKIGDCMAMNINQTNWGVSDYVASYTKQGNENYSRLAKLADEFPQIGATTISVICKGDIGQGGDSQTLKRGAFKLSAERYEETRKTLEYVSKFVPFCKKVKGRKGSLYGAIAFCYEQTRCNPDRLYEKFIENADEFRNIANGEAAIEKLEDIYNRNLSRSCGSRVSIAFEFENHRRAKGKKNELI